MGGAAGAVGQSLNQAPVQTGSVAGGNNTGFGGMTQTAINSQAQGGMGGGMPTPPASQQMQQRAMSPLMQQQMAQQQQQFRPQQQFQPQFRPQQQFQQQGIQQLLNQMIMRFQPQMQQRQMPMQALQQRSQALQYRPNMTQAQQALSRVKPSVYKTDLDTARARIAELEAAQQPQDNNVYAYQQN